MTDNAEKKLLSLCDVAQQDLELSNLSEEGELLSHWSTFVICNICLCDPWDISPLLSNQVLFTQVAMIHADLGL